MQRSIVFGIAGLLAGLIIGFFAANSINRRAASQLMPVAPSDTTSPVLGQQQPAAPGVMQPEVAQALDKAKNEPESFEAQMNAGDMYARIGNLDKARGYFEIAAPHVPNTFEGNVRLANAFFDIKVYEDAAKFYTKALELKPNDIDARTDLGSTYIERPSPDFDKGINEFNESLKIDPKHEPTLFNLARAYFKKGDIEDAKKTAARLAESNPASPLIERLNQSFSKK